MGISASIDPRGIATLTIDNPAKLNVLDSRLLASLAAEADALAQRPDLRAIVLRGTGERAFIGGADINEMAALDQTSARRFITLVHQSCEALRRIPVPVLARVQGYALGAGLEIAASCDLRLAAADARFGMPEVRIGIPSVPTSQRSGWRHSSKRHAIVNNDPLKRSRGARISPPAASPPVSPGSSVAGSPHADRAG
jgi:enoyl-CoA hydratase/carnithine racemase